MPIKTTLNYSPNFDPKKRQKKSIKFLIFHYTGMRKESDSINRLTDFQSEVASHYLIKRNGEILCFVPEPYIAWHAGKSFWKKHYSINRNSIGIEMSNPGHRFGYPNFTSKQIKSLIKLSKELIRKYGIKKKFILGHSDISPDRKKDPGEKFPWKLLSKKKIGIWHNLFFKFFSKFTNKFTISIDSNFELLPINGVESLMKIFLFLGRRLLSSLIDFVIISRIIKQIFSK